MYFIERSGSAPSLVEKKVMAAASNCCIGLGTSPRGDKPKRELQLQGLTEQVMCTTFVCWGGGGYVRKSTYSVLAVQSTLLYDGTEPSCSRVNEMGERYTG